MPKIRPRYVRDLPKICPRYARDMPKICQRYARDICNKKFGQNVHHNSGVGSISPFQNVVRFGAKCLGAKCPWGILSRGILSFGAKCLLAVCQWVINVFSGIPANQVSSFVQKDTASPIHFSCRGHLSAAGSRLRSQNDNEICQTHSQFQWRFKAWWITVFRCLH